MYHSSVGWPKVDQEEPLGLLQDQVLVLNILFNEKRLYLLRWHDIDELFFGLGVAQKKISPNKVSACFNGVNAEFEIPRVGEPVPRELALSVRRFLMEASKDLFN